MSSLRLLRHNCPHLKGPKYDLKIYVDDAVRHIHTYIPICIRMHTSDFGSNHLDLVLNVNPIKVFILLAQKLVSNSL